MGGMSQEVSEELIARQPPEAQAIIRALLAQLSELKAEVARLKKTPRNSSLPPSSEHPHAKPPPKKKPKGKKKRGGQPGHERRQRPLRPTGECDDVQTHKPTECRGCGAALSGDDPAPLRHQVWEVPQIKPHVTEHQRHRLTCACCGVKTCAPLRAGVPTGQAGPNLVALAALLLGCYRQSKRRTARFLQEVLGQPCSTGWVVKLQDQASAALEAPYEQVKAALPAEPVVGMDETPTKQRNQKSWLWTCVANKFTVFQVRPNRKADALLDLLGEDFAGVVNCDRAKMYFSLDRVQWCWAHLRRDFQALCDSPDRQVKRLGQDLVRPTKELFRLWARVRDGTLTRRGFRRLMKPVRVEVEALLLRGAFSGNDRLLGMCEELYKRRAWLWTFVDVEGVEPTNNASERALRHAVIWRKLSFGTQSAKGSRFVERMLTLVETCRQQGRNALAYLAEALRARRHSQDPTSLLPGA